MPDTTWSDYDIKKLIGLLKLSVNSFSLIQHIENISRNRSITELFHSNGTERPVVKC